MAASLLALDAQAAAPTVHSLQYFSPFSAHQARAQLDTRAPHPIARDQGA